MLKEKQIHNVEELNEALVSLLDGQDFKQGMEKACRIIAQHLGGEHLFLIKTKQESEVIDFSIQLALSQLNGDWKVSPSPVGTYLTIDAPPQRCWVKSYEKGEIIIGQLNQYQGKHQSLFEEAGFNHFMHLPIRVDSSTWGILTIASSKQQESWIPLYTDMVRPLLLAMGNLLARKMVENELKSQRDYLRKIIDHIPSMVFAKDRQGRYVMANQSVAKVYGTSPEELLGKSDVDFNTNREEVDRFHKDDLEVIQSQKIKFIPSETVTNTAGETRYYQTVKIPFADDETGEVKELIGVATDITYQKEIEHRIKQEKRLLEMISGTTPDIIALIDLERQDVIYSNLSGFFLGHDFSKEDSPLELFHRIIHPSDIHIAHTDFVKKMRDAEDDDVVEAEYRLRDTEGNLHWFKERAKVFKRHQNGELHQYISFLQNITENKVNEEKILESQRRYRNFIKYSTDGIYYMGCSTPISIDLPIEAQLELYYEVGQIEECNIAMAKMYGYDNSKKLLGLRIADIHAGPHMEENKNSFRTFIKEGYRVENVETIEEDINGNTKIFTNQAVGVIRDGHLVGIWGSQQDITTKRAVMEALKESEALQKAVLKALPDLKFRINKDGVYTAIYPSTSKVPGIYAKPNDFLHKSINDMMPAYLAKGMNYNLQKALATKEVQRFEYALPANGKLIYFEARLSAIDDNQVITVIRDISERKKFQEALQEKYRELDIKNRQLQKYIDSNMQLENFAYIASHDLREPIRTMRTFAQLLKKRYGEGMDQAASAYLKFIIDSAHNMNQLIEDLLTYSRVNTEELVFEAISPKQILEETIQDLDNVIQQKGATIRLKNIPIRIQGNLTRMKQLFQNLLANAIKFSKLDQAPVVEVSAKDTGYFWQFSVKDNGIGIEEEFFEKIFLLFKKLHSRKDFHGTGIGLALCKKIVVQHGGEIWVESEPGKNTTFYFTIKKNP
ncbi:MAG: PAS domain S-box protein [Saprospiraceae bacterium]|nr:PAS domain S-box protein [Saprospiraceae bacterium]